MFKLGKLPPRHDPRTLRLAKYLLASDSLPIPPGVLNYSNRVPSWGMFKNDALGDCTCAGAAHMIELWTALIDSPVVPAESTIVDAYNLLSPDDSGCVLLDVLNYWRKTGFGGMTIDGYAQLDLQNQNHVKLSVSMFGGVYMGIQVPAKVSTGASTQSIFDAPVWDVADDDGGNCGGHCINAVGYDPTGVYVVTWGKTVQMTWAFFNRYADEAYAVLTESWKDKVPDGSEGFAQLEADLAKVGDEIL